MILGSTCICIYTCVSSVFPSPLAPKLETLTVVGGREETRAKLFKRVPSSLRFIKLLDLKFP